MINISKYLIRLLLLLTLIRAQWSMDASTPQLIGTGVQSQAVSIPGGGLYIAWLTDGNYHVYIQRLNALGEAQFDESGMLVSDHDNASWIAYYHMNLAIDGENNAIITVLDERNGPWNVYAYKISPDGSMVWGEDGLALSVSSYPNYSPRLSVMPDNDVIVAWSPNSTSIQIQKISSNGSLMWGDGIIIEDENESLMSPQPIVNSDGDLLVQWIGQSGQVWAANSILYLQKYDLNGIPQWGEPKIITGPVVFPMGNWSQELKPDIYGGSFSSWTAMSGNVQSAFTQNIDVNGNHLWENDIEFSTNASSFRMSPRLAISEENNELMAVWNQSNSSQTQRGIYAQRLDGNGNHLWGSFGAEVVSLNNQFDYLDISTTEFDNHVITVYIQQSTDMTGDIYATRHDDEGNSVWLNDSVIVTNSGAPKSDMMTTKGPDCLFITWSENGSVYAHCLRDDGTLNAPDVNYSDCIAEDGTDGINLWGECYSIQNTTILYLTYSDLSDTIPNTIGSLVNLTDLILEGNQLFGEIPSEIGNLTNLRKLRLGYNALTGEIPSEIGNLISLTSLSFTNNQLFGQIPSEIGNLVNLTGGYYGPGGMGWEHGLDLSNNFFSGELPSEIINLVNLSSIDLSNNYFIGNILPELCNLTGLVSINMSNNQFSGDIPLEIGNLLNLSGMMTGHAPAITVLPALDLSFNQFSGIIPQAICDLPVDWENLSFDGQDYFAINDNEFCPPYPSCIEYSVGEQNITNCEDFMDWNFTIGDPIIELSGDDEHWNPGESIIIEMDFCNNSDTGHMYYPGVVLETTSSLISIDSDHYWFYAMDSDTCHTVSFSALADSAIYSDTLINFIAYPEALNCQNQPIYCIDGDTVTIDVPIILQFSSNDLITVIPKEYILYQNYPNPFNPFTMIRYDLPEESYVNLTIYDMLGNIVINLVDQYQTSGSKSIQWDGTNFKGLPASAGIYMYSIESTQGIQTKKMALLK